MKKLLALTLLISGITMPNTDLDYAVFFSTVALGGFGVYRGIQAFANWESSGIRYDHNNTNYSAYYQRLNQDGHFAKVLNQAFIAHEENIKNYLENWAIEQPRLPQYNFNEEEGQLKATHKAICQFRYKNHAKHYFMQMIGAFAVAGLIGSFYETFKNHYSMKK